MRLFILACGLAAGLFASLTAQAAPPDLGLRAAAYVELGFGGTTANDSLCYGLRLNPARLQAGASAPDLLSLDLGRRGLVAAKLGGIDLGRTWVLLNASDAAPGGGDAGWGTQLGSVFKGIGIGAGALLAAGAVATVVIVNSLGSDDFQSQGSNGGEGGSGDPGSVNCAGRIDIVGPCSPLGLGSVP